MSRKITLSINYSRPLSNRSLNPSKLKHSNLKNAVQQRNDSFTCRINRTLNYQEMLTNYETFFSNNQPRKQITNKKPNQRTMNNFFFKNKFNERMSLSRNQSRSKSKSLLIESICPKSLSKTIDMGLLNTKKQNPLLIKNQKETEASSQKSLILKSQYQSLRKQNHSSYESRASKQINSGRNQSAEISIIESNFDTFFALNCEKKKSDSNVIMLNPFLQIPQKDESSCRTIDFQEVIKAYTVQRHLKQIKLR